MESAMGSEVVEAGGKRSWPEIDFLRGLAALLMILNHGGNNLLRGGAGGPGFIARLVFLGGCAPVLFFFTTGVGYGLKLGQAKKPNYWQSILYKATILLLADQLSFWSRGLWYGLDFFGFIAFSMIVLAAIRLLRHSAIYAALGFIAAFVLRFLVGPFMIRKGIAIDGLLLWLVGTGSLDNVSYPFAPWIGYPFAGYLFGAALASRKMIEGRKRMIIAASLLAVFTICLMASLMMRRRGLVFFRWGTVSLGFYVMSYAVLAMGILACLGVDFTLKGRIRKSLALRGISSFAVVPVHYILISIVVSLGFTDMGDMPFLLVFVSLVVASFFLGHRMDWLSDQVSQRLGNPLVLGALIALFLAFVFLAFYSGSRYAGMETFVDRIGQLLICMLLRARK
jgi:uncharacterized membrane protein